VSSPQSHGKSWCEEIFREWQKKEGSKMEDEKKGKWTTITTSDGGSIYQSPFIIVDRESYEKLQSENKELSQKCEGLKARLKEENSENLRLAMKCEKLEEASLDLTERLYQSEKKCEKLEAEKKALHSAMVDMNDTIPDIKVCQENYNNLWIDYQKLMVKNENQRKELANFNKRHNKALEDKEYWKEKAKERALSLGIQAGRAYLNRKHCADRECKFAIGKVVYARTNYPVGTSPVIIEVEADGSEEMEKYFYRMMGKKLTVCLEDKPCK
jgi:myosin heavy subunit